MEIQEFEDLLSKTETTIKLHELDYGFCGWGILNGIVIKNIFNLHITIGKKYSKKTILWINECINIELEKVEELSLFPCERMEE